MENESERLLIALYKARQQTLNRIEETQGPLSQWETQNELPVSIGEAKSYLNMTSEQLNQEAKRFPILFQKGWIVPEGRPSSEGDYAIVKFTPIGVRKAKALLKERSSGM